MKRKIKQLWARRPGRKVEPEKSLDQAISNLPRITNETVAEHREEVLSSARRYIYPLQHSLRRIVTISAIIFAVLVVGFFVYCLLALYRFNNTSTFMYRITQVIPFPVARASGDFVSYESYLFEIRHYLHYYQTQQQVDFKEERGRQQLEAFRKVALQLVIDEAYIKQLAKEHDISVSDKEVNDQINLLRSQNRLGGNDDVFEDVLREFWGWSISDFRRELRGQMLTQKVVSAMDTQTHDRAHEVLGRLQAGVDFAELAKQYSDDAGTKSGGGDYGVLITKTNRDLAPQVINELFRLQPGQTSDIVETPVGLEVLKVREVNGANVRASHIFLQFKPASTYIKPLEDKSKPRRFISP